MSQQQEGDYPYEQLDENTLNKAFQKMELKQFSNFRRSKFQPNEDGIQCMNIDVGLSTAYILKSKKQRQIEPIIRIYAVTMGGNSLQIDVKGFVPYFYTELPRIGTPNKEQLQLITDNINAHFAQVQQQKKKKTDTYSVNKRAITNISYVQKKNIRGYIPDEYANNNYWKIETSTPNVIYSLRKMFYQQIMISNFQLPKLTFQSNIPYILRFMIDRDIVGMGWMRIKNYTIIKKQGQDTEQNQQRTSDPKCQLQIQCDVQDIQSMSEKMQMPPLRILSFDIECAAEHGFPEPESHQVIQIACVCKTSDQQEEDYRVVFVLNGAEKISGVHVKACDTEKDLLLNFEKLIISYDPDFITGYNMVNFDLNYILERAKHLKMLNYGLFGRSNALSKIKKAVFRSKIMGNRQTKQINIDGRIQLDMFIHMHKQYKLSSYRLNSVAYEILNDQKEDVHHSQIYKLFKGGKDTRKRLAIYCLKDAQLPLRLMEKLGCLFNYSQMARVTGVPINFLLNRGQQIKVMSQLLRKCKKTGYICPTEQVRQNNNEVGFEGAYVLDPQVGFYEDPITTLDFASLYPSIMIAHNLCYTTLVKSNFLSHYNIQKENLTQTLIKETKVYFVKKSVHPGILPEILTELLSARLRAKSDLKKQTDPMRRKVLQGRQLALKISANSVYGFTGALVGQLPCLQISSSVTYFGRLMIQDTKKCIQDQYPGSKVIYGDTDSVMVKFMLSDYLKVIGTEDQVRTAKIKESMAKGQKAADQITKALFPDMDPIKLQYQKVYCPYLLIAKKRYAGLYYSQNPQKHDKIDKKGIESVRRDNCVLIRRILQMVLKLILQESNHNGRQRAVQYIKEQISLLVRNKIDISQLVISKGITKKAGQQPVQENKDNDNNKKNKKKENQNVYKVKQAHVQLAQKMKKRDQNINISIGDRISYVMINGQKGSKNYNNAQDPILVLNQNLPIDYDYYINKQIRPPLERLLEKTGIISNLDALFFGEHTKNRYIPKIGKSNFFSKFIHKKQTCVNCSTLTELDLCEVCQGKRQQIYLKKKIQYLKMNKQYSDYWQECVQCQGSNYNQILCKNEDCPIFYRRIKIKNDLQQNKKQFDRLRWQW